MTVANDIEEETKEADDGVRVQRDPFRRRLVVDDDDEGAALLEEAAS